MEIRREVLGDEHVNATIERTTPFTETFKTSSPATPGVRSGPAPASTAAPGVASP